jgi:hypothetical protein
MANNPVAFNEEGIAVKYRYESSTDVFWAIANDEGINPAIRDYVSKLLKPDALT